MIGWDESFFEIAWDGSHKVKANDIIFCNILDACFVDGAGANIGSGSRNPNAKSPASLGNFLSTLFCTFLKFSFASIGAFTFTVLVWALFLDAISEFLWLGEGEDDQEHGKKDKLHLLYVN